METALVIIQGCVVIGAIVLGVRTGGIGLGLWGVVGTAVLVFVFRLPPGSPPIDAFFIIIAVITASSAMQAAGGIDYLVSEGEEETISHLEAFVEAHPELFARDAAVIADIGGQEVGRPGLTVALRGDVACTVTVRTLANPVHSGEFGGAAPDAVTAMIRILDTLHDENGDTVIPGVDSGRWDGAAMDEPVYREGSAILPGVAFLGTGSLADRVWMKPSVTVLGMDLPNTAEASNVLLPSVTAKLSMRIIPGSDADAQLEALMAHLRSQRPWNCVVEVEKVKVGHAFRVDESHPAIPAAMDAMREAYGREVESIGSGASIPLVASIKKVAPDAAILLWGAEDTKQSRIHASDESVDPDEIERMIVTQTLFIRKLSVAM